LAVASGVTELYKRLRAPGLLGAVARERWLVIQAILPTPSAVATLSASKLATHHTGYILRRVEGWGGRHPPGPV
jgi:hypothetical protein